MALLKSSGPVSHVIVTRGQQSQYCDPETTVQYEAGERNSAIFFGPVLFLLYCVKMSAVKKAYEAKSVITHRLRGEVKSGTEREKVVYVCLYKRYVRCYCQ